jgi:uncharacterized SAM-binding protein YcdF (DUF218 family)
MLLFGIIVQFQDAGIGVNLKISYFYYSILTLILVLKAYNPHEKRTPKPVVFALSIFADDWLVFGGAGVNCQPDFEP